MFKTKQKNIRRSRLHTEPQSKDRHYPDGTPDNAGGQV